MSIRDIKARLHEAIDALPDDVRFSNASSDIETMKVFLQAIYSQAASFAWYCGADGGSIQSEAVPACDVIDNAFYELTREAEFSAPSRRSSSARHQRAYGTLNHSQQGLSR